MNPCTIAIELVPTRASRPTFFPVVLVLLVLAATSCGVGSTDVASTTTASAPASTTTTVAPTTTQPSTAVATIDAASAYLRRCGGCHGAAGTEQAAQTLAGVASNSESWVRINVMDGGGDMPAFGDSLDPAEIDAIVAYVMTSFP